MAEEIKGEKRFKPTRVFHIPTQTWHDRQPVDAKEIVRENPAEWSFTEDAAPKAKAEPQEAKVDDTKAAPKGRGGKK